MTSARDVFDRAERDPVWFARHILGVRLWDAQAQILQSLWVNRRVSVKSANGIGKSFLGAVAVLAFGSIYKDAVIVTTATTFKQVKGILFREIGRIAHRSRYPLGVEVLATEVRWEHGSMAIGITAPETDVSKLQGFRGARTMIIADEAGGIAPAIIEGITAMLTGEGVRLLMIGNPTDPTSEFAKSFQNESVKTFSIPAFSTPNFTSLHISEEDIASGSYLIKMRGKDLPAPHLVTPQWVRDRWEEWGPSDPRYIARVLAKFPDENEESLFPLRWIEAAMELEPSPDGTNELGVDIARMGSDETIAYHRKGNHAQRVLRLAGHDTMAVTGAIVKLRRDTGATAIKVDEIGVGAGVVDRLKELGEPVVGINVGRASSNQEQYTNLRSELFWSLRERFEKGEISIKGAPKDLVRQLHAIRWRLGSKGQIVIEPKDETKKRIDGRSPDDADALMLAFAPTPKKKSYVIV